MIVDVKVPDLGENVQEAVIVAWHKQLGDAVVQGEPLLEVMTDKVNVEVECPANGTLREQRANPDDLVKIGAVIATIETG